MTEQWRTQWSRQRRHQRSAMHRRHRLHGRFGFGDWFGRIDLCGRLRGRNFRCRLVRGHLARHTTVHLRLLPVVEAVLVVLLALFELVGVVRGRGFPVAGMAEVEGR